MTLGRDPTIRCGCLDGVLDHMIQHTSVKMTTCSLNGPSSHCALLQRSRTMLRSLLVTACMLSIALTLPIVDDVAGQTGPADSNITVRVSTVLTTLGPVHGACNESTCRWLNIPFSEPFARFKQSTPRTSSYGAGVGSGTQYGPACHQFLSPALLASAGIDVGQQSEDCTHSHQPLNCRYADVSSVLTCPLAGLNLNVFAPANTSSETPLPVMVFVCGGGFLEGSSGQSAGKIPGKGHGLTYIAMMARDSLPMGS